MLSVCFFDGERKGNSVVYAGKFEGKGFGFESGILGQPISATLYNDKRIRRLMRKMALMPIYSKKNLSRLGLAKYIHPYLLRHLSITRPNQVWAIDITYIPMRHGFMYLTAIIDAYSRFAVE